MYPVLGTEVPQLQIANGPETNRQHRENSPNSLLRNKIWLIQILFVSLQREIIMFVCDE